MSRISCVSNEVGGSLVGNAKWTGVHLRDLLDRAGVRPRRDAGGRSLVRRLDRRLPDRVARRSGRRRDGGGRDERRDPDAGPRFPARLIVPGLYGYVSATKWLTNIELTTLEAFDGYWIPLGWSKRGPILLQSRIDVRAARASVGQVPVAGIAWAPTRGISKVEVQVDDGDMAGCRPGARDL